MIPEELEEDSAGRVVKRVRKSLTTKGEVEKAKWRIVEEMDERFSEMK